MTEKEILDILTKQKAFYNTGATLSVDFRKEQLEKLYSAVKRHEKEINDALKKDLGKSSFESFMCESGFALTEISFMMKHVKKFSKKQKIKTPLAQFRSKSYRVPIPYGTVLIMSPWNYPFLLSIEPLANAIAAGNTAVIKPSAYSPATSEVVRSLIEECFPPQYVSVIKGGREENASLLNQKFDLIFFTGSGSVGKEVLRKSAENLTPAILELGGKSPCIVDKSANLPLAAKRIVFGKYLNCGQTCVAPDHIYCHSQVKEEFISHLINEIKLQFGENALNSLDYGKIINEKHFSRLVSLIDKSKVVYGGEYDVKSLKIAPTVLNNVSENDEIMKEEIFGPIMPILTFESFGELIELQEKKSKPLALYLFSKDKKQIDTVTHKLSFGGGCINDVIIHLATSNMGFGGVGESGMGSYHGKAGFDAFSHYKSIVDKKTWIDLPMRYQPYNKKLHEKLLHLFLK